MAAKSDVILEGMFNKENPQTSYKLDHDLYNKETLRIEIRKPTDSFASLLAMMQLSESVIHVHLDLSALNAVTNVVLIAPPFIEVTVVVPMGCVSYFAQGCFTSRICGCIVLRAPESLYVEFNPQERIMYVRERGGDLYAENHSLGNWHIRPFPMLP